MPRAPHADPLAPPPASAGAPARHARLGERLRTLLAPRRAGSPPPTAEAATSRLPGSSWPDSFFDVDPAP